MGLFDYVYLPFKCPKCKYGEKDHDWQTKVGEPFNFRYRVGDSVIMWNIEMNEGFIEIHTLCPKCDKYTSAKVKIAAGKITGEVSYSKIKEAQNKQRAENKIKIDTKHWKKFFSTWRTKSISKAEQSRAKLFRSVKGPDSTTIIREMRDSRHGPNSA